MGSGIEDLGAGTCSQVGTAYGSVDKGPRYLSLTEGYVQKLALDEEDRIIGYSFVHLGKMMRYIADGMSAQEALDKASGTYGRYQEAVRLIDPRRE